MAGVLAAVVGMLIAYLCLRYRLAGAYFALATFAFAQMFLLLVQNVDALNKTEGFNIPILPSDSWAKMQFQQGSPNYFWIPLGILAVGVLTTILFARSRSGQFVQAARDDETAAASLGHQRDASPAAHRRAQLRDHLDGRRLLHAVLPVRRSRPGLRLPGLDRGIVPAVIGGIGTVWGPVIGAAIIGPLSEVIASLLRNPPPFLDFLQGTAGLDVTLYAVILIAIVLFLPKGSLRLDQGPVAQVSLLEIDDLSKSFAGLHAVQDVTVRLDEHEFLGVIGPNGAGKTTLFSMLAGEQVPTSGRVVFDGQDVTGWPAHRVADAGLVRTFQLMRPVRLDDRPGERDDRSPAAPPFAWRRTTARARGPRPRPARRQYAVDVGLAVDRGSQAARAGPGAGPPAAGASCSTRCWPGSCRPSAPR